MSDKKENNKQSTQIIIYTNDIIKNNIEPMLGSAGISELCAFETYAENELIIRYNKQEITFSLPLRIGMLLDQIKQISKQIKNQKAALLDLGYGQLDTHLGTFIFSEKTEKSKKESILLTEKEIEILRYLYDNIPRKIPREELLEFVWGYAKNVETHTLETHIYRLRRKIEPNPASPVILKKDEEGYFIGNDINMA